MTATAAIWLGVAVVSATMLVLTAAKWHRGRRGRTTAIRAAWLVAAASGTTVLVFISAKVMDLMPGGATATDVCALAVTGLLSGLFLGFGLVPRREKPVEGDGV